MIDGSSVSSSEILIEAPAEVVWDVIVDFARYGDWNTFCPEIEGKLELGAGLRMKVDLGNGLQQQVEYVTCIEAPHKIVWSMENKPGDPIHADRTQRIEPVDALRCSYWTVDEFRGDAVAPMMNVLAARIEAGFERCARGLKAEAERRYRASR